MKRLLIGCLAVPLFATACGDPMEVASPNSNGINTVKQGVAPNRYIVVLNPGTNASSSAHQLAAAHGGNVTAVWEHALSGFAIEISPQGLNGLQKNPAVKYVEPDIVMSKLDVGQTAPTGIPRIEADLDPIATAGAVDATVAIIDTGIDEAHPDLDGLVLAHVDCAGGGPYGRKGCEPGGTDGNGHGTHVAGTVAALDNDIGVVGVAPGADLVGVRVLDDRGSGYMSWIINGVDWVTENKAQWGIDVANMSLGGAGGSTALEDAIGNSVAAGILYTVAAGNSSADIHDSDGKCAYSPACIDAAMTISALADTDGKPGGLGPDASYVGDDRNNDGIDDGADDSFAFFSNYSSLNGIDLILPGVDINSTVPGGGYDSYSGTSMAAPHAAGLAALEIARRKASGESTDVNTVRQALVDAAKAQDSADGLVHLNDPDGNYEPLGYAVASEPVCSTDDDEDTYVADTCGGGDCNDQDPTINPGADELCGNDVDENCDGQTDEGFGLGEECTIGTGACEGSGVMVCSTDGTSSYCDATEGSPEAEVCDSVDNDCDGQTDEDFAVGETCTVGTGACESTGSTICNADGTGVECDAEPGTGSEEVCGDGIDNDCDGYTDADDPEGCAAEAQCKPVGESCDGDSECCSNKCRGGGPKGSFCK